MIRPSMTVAQRKLPGTAILLLAAALSLIGAPDRGIAQDYPSRPIKVIMPLGPGGVGDVFLRAIGQELTKALGQPVIVENRPGGATIVGSQACAQSQPDGYTLCMLAIDFAQHRAVLLQEHPVRSREGLRPDHAVLLHRGRLHGPPLAEREHGRGADRALEGEARDLELRDPGQCAHPVHGRIQEGHRRRPATGPVPERRRGHQCGSRRSCSGGIFRDRQPASQRARGARQADRGRQQGAYSALSERADAGGSRLYGHSDQALVGIVRAGRYAESDFSIALPARPCGSCAIRPSSSGISCRSGSSRHS